MKTGKWRIYPPNYIAELFNVHYVEFDKIGRETEFALKPGKRMVKAYMMDGKQPTAIVQIPQSDFVGYMKAIKGAQNG